MNMLAPKDHNLAPVEASETDALIERLAKDNGELLQRHNHLIEGMTRLPEKCDTEEVAAKLTTFGVQLKACSDALEAKRKEEKRPYDEKCSAVHSFFKTKSDVLDGAILIVKTKIKTFIDAEKAKKEREAVEQRRRDEEKAKLEREAAQKLLDEAAALQASGMTHTAEKALEDAHAMEQQAAQTQEAAQNTVAASVGILRGAGGGSSSAGGRWKAEILDVNTLDLEALRSFIGMDALQTAINGWMKIKVKQLRDGDPAPEIKGGKIYKDTNISLRG
jgi:hypothetical protein